MFNTTWIGVKTARLMTLVSYLAKH